MNPIPDTGVFTFHIDFGQIVITSFIAVMGWLLLNMIGGFKERLNKHDELLIGLVGDVQRLIGLTHNWNGHDRRVLSREEE